MAASVPSPFYIISDDPTEFSLDAFQDRLHRILNVTSGFLPAPYIQLRLKNPVHVLAIPSIVDALPPLWRSRILINVSRTEDVEGVMRMCKEKGVGGVHVNGNVLKELGTLRDALWSWRQRRHASPQESARLGKDPAVSACTRGNSTPSPHSQQQEQPDIVAIGASCHSLGDLLQASRLGLTLAVLSPVLPSTTCPSDSTLGWEGFERILRQFEDADRHGGLSVYALGGVSAKDVGKAQKCGAAGVAAIRAFWYATDFGMEQLACSIRLSPAFARCTLSVDEPWQIFGGASTVAV